MVLQLWTARVEYVRRTGALVLRPGVCRTKEIVESTDLQSSGTSFGFQVWYQFLNDARPFLDDENLIGIEVRESLDLLGCRPLHFEGINLFGLADTEVQPKIAL